MFAKVGASNWEKEAYRIIMWWFTEFLVLSKGRILDADGGFPEVRFVSDPASEYRCRFDLSDNLVDLYRPKLLAKLAKIGLPWKTLIIEDDGVWDFQQKLDPDPDNVSLGYKLLVTRLDAASRENEWQVRIMPRPDIKIGDTIHSSKIDPDTHYMLHGNSLSMDGTRLQQTVILSDHETYEGGTVGNDGCS
jgi:hypothetical protein